MASSVASCMVIPASHSQSHNHSHSHSHNPGVFSSQSLCLPPSSFSSYSTAATFPQARRLSWKPRRRLMVLAADAASSSTEVGEGKEETAEKEEEKEGSVPETAPSTIIPPFRSKRSKAAKNRQVMLRFVWMEKNIGIGLDLVVPGQGSVPLSPFYFWPRKDAWEEIKTKLESKKWISRKQTILLLNQATDIINLWQQNATG